MKLHYATCAAWETGRRTACDCPPQNVWRIRRLGFRRHEVSRFLDGEWTRFMVCKNKEAAVQLLVSLQWLTTEGMRRVG